MQKLLMITIFLHIWPALMRSSRSIRGEQSDRAKRADWKGGGGGGGGRGVGADNRISLCWQPNLVVGFVRLILPPAMRVCSQAKCHQGL